MTGANPLAIVEDAPDSAPELRLNGFERAIAAISPSWAASRARHRMALELLDHQRKYDGASRGRRTAGWHVTNGSGSAEVEGSAVLLRARSRDLIRNDAWAHKALETVVSVTVGHGLSANWTVGSARRSQRWMARWKAWAETKACDARGKHNLYGIQQLVMRTVAESGEALVIREIDRANPSGIPFQLRVIEPDHLDASRDELIQDRTGRDGVVRQGIEYDSRGRVRGYWLFPDHPGDRVTWRNYAYESEFYPADQVAHIYREDRPGQGRGVPWASSVMIRHKDLNDYLSNQLLRQKLAACYVAFVTEPEPPPGLNTKKSRPPTHLEPGAIEILPTGRDMRFASPPGVEGYESVVKLHLHEIAAGWGISYEALTGDLKEVSFSSGRMGWIEMYRNVDTWRWNMLVPMLLDTVADWFRLGMELAGEGEPTRAVSAVDWTPPKRDMIDPAKEMEAYRIAVRAGFMTRSQVLRQLGEDPDVVHALFKSDNDTADNLGLVFDTDARLRTNNGQPAEAQSNEAERAAADLLRSMRDGE